MGTLDWFQEPLFNAVAKGDDVAVTRLLSLGQGSIYCSDQKGLTVLHWAAASAESELLVPLLLGKSKPLN